MQDWSIPLAIATAAFFAIVLWRIRPVIGRGQRGRREALRTARQRVEAAADGPARALALCDAADIAGRTLAGKAASAAYYQRALRTDPTSAEIVKRVAAGLSGRPRSLESLLWRHLGSAPWSGSSVDAVRTALGALCALYDGPLRNAPRARALGFARDAVQPGAQSSLGSA